MNIYFWDSKELKEAKKRYNDCSNKYYSIKDKIRTIENSLENAEKYFEVEKELLDYFNTSNGRGEEVDVYMSKKSQHYEEVKAIISYYYEVLDNLRAKNNDVGDDLDYYKSEVDKLK